MDKLISNTEKKGTTLTFDIQRFAMNHTYYVKSDDATKAVETAIESTSESTALDGANTITGITLSSGAIEISALNIDNADSFTIVTCTWHPEVTAQDAEYVYTRTETKSSNEEAPSWASSLTEGQDGYTKTTSGDNVTYTQTITTRNASDVSSWLSSGSWDSPPDGYSRVLNSAAIAHVAAYWELSTNTSPAVTFNSSGYTGTLTISSENTELIPSKFGTGAQINASSLARDKSVDLSGATGIPDGAISVGTVTATSNGTGKITVTAGGQITAAAAAFADNDAISTKYDYSKNTTTNKVALTAKAAIDLGAASNPDTLPASWNTLDMGSYDLSLKNDSDFSGKVITTSGKIKFASGSTFISTSSDGTNLTVDMGAKVKLALASASGAIRIGTDTNAVQGVSKNYTYTQSTNKVVFLSGAEGGSTNKYTVADAGAAGGDRVLPNGTVDIDASSATNDITVDDNATTATITTVKGSTAKTLTVNNASAVTSYKGGKVVLADETDATVAVDTSVTGLANTNITKTSVNATSGKYTITFENGNELTVSAYGKLNESLNRVGEHFTYSQSSDGSTKTFTASADLTVGTDFDYATGDFTTLAMGTHKLTLANANNDYSTVTISGTGKIVFDNSASLSSTAIANGKITVTTDKGTIKLNTSETGRVQKAGAAAGDPATVLPGVSQYYTYDASSKTVTLLAGAAGKSFTFFNNDTDKIDYVIPADATTIVASAVQGTVTINNEHASADITISGSSANDKCNLVLDSSAGSKKISVTDVTGSVTAKGGTTAATGIKLTDCGTKGIIYQGGQVEAGGTVINKSITVGGTDIDNAHITASGVASSEYSITFGADNVLTTTGYDSLAETVTAFDRVSDKFKTETVSGTPDKFKVTVTADAGVDYSDLPSTYDVLDMASKKLTVDVDATVDYSAITNPGVINFPEGTTLTKTEYQSTTDKEFKIVTSGGTVKDIKIADIANIKINDAAITGVDANYTYDATTHTVSLLSTATGTFTIGDQNEAGATILPGDVTVIKSAGATVAGDITIKGAENKALTVDVSNVTSKKVNVTAGEGSSLNVKLGTLGGDITLAEDGGADTVIYNGGALTVTGAQTGDVIKPGSTDYNTVSTTTIANADPSTTPATPEKITVTLYDGASGSAGTIILATDDIAYLKKSNGSDSFKEVNKKFAYTQSSNTIALNSNCTTLSEDEIPTGVTTITATSAPTDATINAGSSITSITMGAGEAGKTTTVNLGSAAATVAVGGFAAGKAVINGGSKASTINAASAVGGEIEINGGSGKLTIGDLQASGKIKITAGSGGIEATTGTGASTNIEFIATTGSAGKNKFTYKGTGSQKAKFTDYNANDTLIFDGGTVDSTEWVNDAGTAAADGNHLKVTTSSSGSFILTDARTRTVPVFKDTSATPAETNETKKISNKYTYASNAVTLNDSAFTDNSSYTIPAISGLTGVVASDITTKSVTLTIPDTVTTITDGTGNITYMLDSGHTNATTIKYKGGNMSVGGYKDDTDIIDLNSTGVATGNTVTGTNVTTTGTGGSKKTNIAISLKDSSGNAHTVTLTDVGGVSTGFKVQATSGTNLDFISNKYSYDVGSKLMTLLADTDDVTLGSGLYAIPSATEKIDAGAVTGTVTATINGQTITLGSGGGTITCTASADDVINYNGGDLTVNSLEYGSTNKDKIQLPSGWSFIKAEANKDTATTIDITVQKGTDASTKKVISVVSGSTMGVIPLYDSGGTLIEGVSGLYDYDTTTNTVTVHDNQIELDDNNTKYPAGAKIIDLSAITSSTSSLDAKTGITKITAGGGTDTITYNGGSIELHDFTVGTDVLKLADTINSVIKTEIPSNTEDLKITFNNSYTLTIKGIMTDDNATEDIGVKNSSGGTDNVTKAISTQFTYTASTGTIKLQKEVTELDTANYPSTVTAIDASAAAPTDKALTLNLTSAINSVTLNKNAADQSDTIVYAGGDITITNFQESDKIKLTKANSVFSKSEIDGSDVKVTFTGTASGTITLKNAAAATAAAGLINAVQFIDESDNPVYENMASGFFGYNDGTKTITLNNTPLASGNIVASNDSGEEATVEFTSEAVVIDAASVANSKGLKIFGNAKDNTIKLNNSGSQTHEVTTGDGNDTIIYNGGKLVVKDYTHNTTYNDVIKLGTSTLSVTATQEINSSDGEPGGNKKDMKISFSGTNNDIVVKDYKNLTNVTGSLDVQDVDGVQLPQVSQRYTYASSTHTMTLTSKFTETTLSLAEQQYPSDVLILDATEATTPGVLTITGNSNNNTFIGRVDAVESINGGGGTNTYVLNGASNSGVKTDTIASFGASDVISITGGATTPGRLLKTEIDGDNLKIYYGDSTDNVAQVNGVAAAGNNMLGKLITKKGSTGTNVDGVSGYYGYDLTTAASPVVNINPVFRDTLEAGSNAGNYPTDTTKVSAENVTGALTVKIGQKVTQVIPSTVESAKGEGTYIVSQIAAGGLTFGDTSDDIKITDKIQLTSGITITKTELADDSGNASSSGDNLKLTTSNSKTILIANGKGTDLSFIDASNTAITAISGYYTYEVANSTKKITLNSDYATAKSSTLKSSDYASDIKSIDLQNVATAMVVQGNDLANTIYAGEDQAHTISGGEGKDVFVIGKATATKDTKEVVITDYNANDDVIQFADTNVSLKSYDVLDNGDLKIVGEEADSGHDTTVIIKEAAKSGAIIPSISLIGGANGTPSLGKVSGNISYEAHTGAAATDKYADITINSNFEGALQATLYTHQDSAIGVRNIYAQDVKDAITIEGTAAANSIYGSDEGNTINAGAGNDTVIAGSGDDYINGGGGTGQEYIDAGEGDNRVTIGTSAQPNGANYGNTVIAGKGDDIVVGSAAKDYISAGAGSNSIFAGDGNDSVYVEGEDDSTIYGGGGADYIVAAEGSDYIDAGNDSDTIDAGNGNNTVIGGAGIDIIQTGSGNDSIEGGNDNDSIHGGAGNDYISGGNGNDTLIGGDGDDELVGGAGADLFVYVSGNDYLVDYTPGQYDSIKIAAGTVTESGITENGDVILNIKNGSTDLGTITIKDGKDQKVTIIDGAGNAETRIFGYFYQEGDAITLNADYKGSLTTKDYDATITGINASLVTESNLVINGNATANKIFGSDQNDLIFGDAGADSISGLDGNDTIDGGKDSDTIRGGNDNDSINGGDGDDYLYGDAGEDTIFGGNGSDYIEGGAENDYIDGGAGDDVIKGDAGDDSIFGGAGIDIIEGGDGNDYIDGGNDNDSIHGGAGDNTIYGGAGNDIIIGAGVKNYLDGGSGNDTLTGGPGENTFSDSVGNDIFGIQLSNGDGSDNVIVYYDNKDYISIGGGTVYMSDVEGDNVLMTLTASDNGTGDKGFVTVEGAKDVKMNIIDKNHTAANPLVQVFGYFNYNERADSIAVNAEFAEDALPASLYPTKVKYIDATAVESEAVFHANSAVATTIVGGGIADVTLAGDKNADSLVGGSTNDSLFGGAANDTLVNGRTGGEGGSDSMFGGAGNDVFFHNVAGDILIQDFKAKEDVIRLGAGESVQSSAINNNDVILNIANASGERGSITVAGASGTTLTIVEYTEDADTPGTTEAILGSYSYKKNSNNKITDITLNSDFEGSLTTNTYATSVTLISASEVGNAITINANAAGDSIIGSDSAETINGGAGKDTIYANGGANYVYGNAGHDILIGGDAADYIDGGADDDSIWGGAGNNTLLGGAGNDTIHGGTGDNYIDAGDGNDSVFGDNGNNTISGGRGADTLVGGNKDDSLNGGTENDYLVSGGGFDSMYGGTGNDTFVVSAINESNLLIQDYTNKGTEKDVIKLDGAMKVIDSATLDNDVVLTVGTDEISSEITIKGGKGNIIDIVQTEAGVETHRKGYYGIYNGVGTNNITVSSTFSGTLTSATYDAENSNPVVVIDASSVDAADVNIQGNAQANSILGGDNNIVLFGGAGADSLIGGSGNDSLNGGDDNDSLVGGAGDDNLFGGKGDDTLVGGDGINVLDGGDGNDVFVYINGTDTITKYEPGKDVIAIKNASTAKNAKTIIQESHIAENNKDVILTIAESLGADITETGTITITDGKDKKISLINSTNTDDSVSTFDDALSAATARVYGYYNLGTYDGRNAVSVNSDFTEKEFSPSMYGTDITVVDASKVNEGINVVGNVYGSGASAKGTALFGSDNNDTFTGGSAADSVWAGDGDDLIKGGSGDDIIYGEVGDDKLYGEAGKDSLFAGAGSNTLEGGNDADMFIFDSLSTGENIINDYTPGQNDSIRLDDVEIASTEIKGKDVVLTLSNDGTVTIKGGKDKLINISTLAGGTQNPNEKAYYGYVSWGAMPSNDSIAVNAGFAESELTTKMYKRTVGGTTKEVQYIDATAVDNSIVIRTENINSVGVTVLGGNGDDTVYGNAQNDSLLGGAGDDYIDGGAGNDEIYGEGGDNILVGGDGDDVLHGGSSKDTMTGGNGADKFYYHGGDLYITDWNNSKADPANANDDAGIYLPTNASVTASSVSGKDVILKIGDLGTITVKNGKDKTLKVYQGGGETDNDLVTAVFGYYTWDPLSNPTSVTLSSDYSEKSFDYTTHNTITKIDASQVDGNGVTLAANTNVAGTYLIGSDQADKLSGETGKADTLAGGIGNDTLTGGTGDNTFIYSGGKDVITDYEYNSSKKDKIKLEGVSIAKSAVVGKDVVFSFDDGGTLTVKNRQNKLIQVYDSDTDLTETNVTAKLYGYVDIDSNDDKTLRINSDYSASTFVAKDLAPRAQLTDYEALTAEDVAKGLTINLTDLLSPGNSTGSPTANGNGISLTGSAFNDKLISGVLKDTLIGGAGNDTMTGGNGDDVFVNTAGKDVITDYSAVSNNNDTIVISDGVVTSSTIKSKDVILTINGDANRTVTVSKMKGSQIKVIDNNGTDTRVFGYYNYDSSTKTITLNVDFNEKQLGENDYADDITFVDASNVKKGFMFKTDSDHEAMTVLGSAAADKIYADNGKADSIYAGAGNDLIQAGAVSGSAPTAGDTLAGGAGKNTLVGAAGNNVFVYDGGTDTIKAYSYTAGDSGEQDVILLNDAGMSVASSTVKGKNVELTINKDGKTLGTITVVEGKDKVLSVVNVSGESDTRVFGYYNYGTTAEGDEGKTIVVNTDFSQNPLTGSTGAPNNTTKYNSDVTKIDATQAKKAVQITANPNATSTVVGSKFADKLTAATGQSASLYGGDGNDSLTGKNAADTLFGGAGSDTLTGGEGAVDVFVHSAGNDYITDYDGKNHNESDKDIILLTNGLVVSSSLKGSADVVLGIGSVSGGKASSTITVKGTSKRELTVVDKDGNSDTRIFGYYSYDGATDAVKINTEFAAGTIKSGGEDTTKPYYSSEVRVVNASTVRKAIYIEGNAQANIITGGLGGDKIYGGDEADSIHGGAGNDSLNGGVGEDTLIGGVGNDTLYGGTDNDVFVFVGGKDVIRDYNANSEADRIVIASGNGDKVTSSTVKANSVVLTIGTKGTITIQNAADKILTVTDGSGATEERLFGYYSYDSKTNKITLNADFSKNRLYSTSTMTSAAYYAETIANVDASKVTKAITIDGNGLANSITGSTSKGTTVDAAGGNDTVRGGNGADSLIGGEGEDYLDGGKGNDVLYGGAGKDSLYGGDGNDNLFGDEDDDILVAGAGNDTLTGGDGADKFILSAGNDTITDYTAGDGDVIILDGGAKITASAVKNTNVILTTSKGTITVKDAKDQKLTIYNGANDKNPITGIYGYYDGVGTTAITLNATFTGTLDSVEGGSGTTYYDTDVTVINGSKVKSPVVINGNAKDNVITASSSKATTIDGGAGKDIINGGGGDDYLVGGDDNDVISGGGGNDTIFGGAGNNTISGGGGRDVFVFEGGNDLINDYTQGQDTIKIDGTISESKVNGSNIVFTIGDGTLTVKNTKGKKITVTDANGTTSQVYGNSSGTGPNRISGKQGLLFGGDDNYWFAEEDDANYINSKDDSQLDAISDTKYSVSNVEDSTLDFLNQDTQIPTATSSVTGKKDQNI